MALTLTGCAWPLGEDPGLLGCDAVSLALGSRRFETSLCFHLRVVREDVLDWLTLVLLMQPALFKFTKMK